MPQRTVFPALPNTTEAQYLLILQGLFGELDRRGGDVPFKDFRNWLKERNLWSKEEAEDLFAFLGCRVRPNIVLGDFPRKFIACGGQEEQQRALYLWINAWNPFLTKYVFEALDVDGGGRLHSTHELYRLITSYVYPGAYVTLPNFQSWIRWMAASGYIKYIGIRWGLSDAGKREMSAIRQVDVDELLEDLAEEAAAEPEPSDVPATPAVPAAPPPAPAPAKAAPAPASASDFGDDEEMLDMPPEAPLPTWEAPTEHPLADIDDAPAPAPAPAPAATPAVPARAPEPATPPPARAPKARAAPAAPGPLHTARPTAQPTTTSDLEDTVKRIVTWFSAWPGRRADRAADHGLTPKQYSANRELFMLRILVLARLATEDLPATVWQPFFRQLDADKLFERYLVEGRPLEELLKDAKWFEGKPAWRLLFGRIAFDLMRVKVALTAKATPTLVDALEDAPDAASLLGLLQERLYPGEPCIAPFWVLREMHHLKLWDSPALAAATAVPTAALRANGYRLGFLPTMYADTFVDLMAASEAIAGWLPPAGGGDLPLQVLHEGYGCAFGCQRTLACDLACREKVSPLALG